MLQVNNMHCLYAHGECHDVQTSHKRREIPNLGMPSCGQQMEHETEWAGQSTDT
jgi:hypothetical protein